MGTTQATAAVAARATRARGERHSWAVHYANAAKDELEVKLEHRRDGSWKTFARHVQGTGKARKVARGATEGHAAEAGARAAWERLQAAAVKAGWARREARGGFAGRPDAFTVATLPKASAK